MNDRSNLERVSVPRIAGGARAFPESRTDRTPLGEAKLRLCAWCGKVSLGTDSWGPLDPMLLEECLGEEMVHVTHGVCPDCFDSFLSPRQKPEAPSVRA